MNLLLDTHTFLWWVTDDPSLSTVVHTLIANPENTIYFSVISAWEIMIKSQTGKLVLPELVANQFKTLSVELSHVLNLATLPSHHRDPFDRLLIAQSHSENIPIATMDALITQYPVNVIW